MKLIDFKRHNLIRSSEGSMLVLGLSSAILFGLWLGVNFILWPESAQQLLGMSTTRLIVGRAAGLYLGYTLSLPQGMVLPVNIIIELIWLLIFYPLYIFGIQKLFVIPALKMALARAKRMAEKHQTTMKHLGVPGLIAFIICPLPMTGPLVGGLIGFFMGYRPWYNLGIIFCGSILTNLLWAFGLREAHRFAFSFNTNAPIFLLIIIIAVVLISQLIYRLVHRVQETDESKT